MTVLILFALKSLQILFYNKVTDLRAKFVDGIRTPYLECNNSLDDMHQEWAALKEKLVANGRLVADNSFLSECTAPQFLKATATLNIGMCRGALPQMT